MRKRWALFAALVSASAIWSVGGATSANAHDELQSTVPTNGAKLANRPATVTLSFEEPPLQNTTKMVATADSGQAYALTNLTASGGNISAPWPTDTPAGTYVVAWRNVGSDGHPLTGTFSFSFDTPGEGPPSASRSGSPDASAIATTTTTSSPSTSSTPWLLITGVGIVIIVLVLLGVNIIRRRQNDPPQ